MGAIWFAVALIAVVVLIGVVILVSYVTRSSASELRERNYKKALRTIENKKAKALLDKDGFTAYQADREAVELRERYIAGKDV